MKPSFLFSFLFFTAVAFLASCGDEDEELQKIDDVVAQTGKLPEPPAAYPPKQIGTKPISVNENGITYDCQEVTYSYSNTMEQVIAFNPNAGTLYPGSLVQGQYVQKGELVSIGTFARKPLVLTMDEYGFSRTVDNPDNANSTRAVVDMVAEAANMGTSTIAKVTCHHSEAHSTEQGMLGLGIDLSWFGSKLNSSMSVTQSSEKHSIYINFVQPYYTVSINQPAKASDFFAADVSSDDLKNKISAANPLCYVSSVTYGRMLIAKITTTASMSEITSAVKASIAGQGASFSYTKTKLLDEAEYEVQILGGNSKDAVAAGTGRMEQILDYLNNGADFSSTSLGTPISYVVKYASDNSTVKLGKATEYAVRDDCKVNIESVQKISLQVKQFNIIKGCDAIAAGEFTYDLSITDNSKEIKSSKLSKQTTYSDGASIPIGINFDFSISKSHTLRIGGKLMEWDSDEYNPDAVLVIPDIEFSEPWTKLTDEMSTEYVLIEDGDGCSAELVYSIKKQ